MTDKTAAERIVEAATELFAERGYQATTTRSLAERAGVNEVTIFRLFGSKLGVMGALGERLMVQGAAQSANARPLPEDLRDAVMELAMRELASASTFGRVAMRIAFDAHSVPELAAMMGEGPTANGRMVTDFFRERQERGEVRRDIEPETMADAFFALTSTFIMTRMLMVSATNSKLPDEGAVRQLVEVLLRGIEERG